MLPELRQLDQWRPCCRFKQSAWQDRHGSWTASSLRGHVNFCCTSSDHVNSPNSPAMATDQQPAQAAANIHSPAVANSRPPFHAAATVTSAAAAAPQLPHHAANASTDATAKILAETWSGQDLQLSVQAAITDCTHPDTAQKPVNQQQSLALAPRKAPTAADTILHCSDLSARPSAMPDSGTRVFDSQNPLVNAVADQSMQSSTAATALGSNTSSKAPAVQPNVSQHDRAAKVAAGVDNSSNLGSGCARHLDIKLVPATPDLISVEFPLYKKYQMNNHGDAPGKVRMQSKIDYTFLAKSHL